MHLIKTEGLEKTYQVNVFADEFESVTSERDNTGRYHRWLRRQLILLEQHGIQALRFENFEYLQDTDPPLYCIRYPHSKVNPRVIYIYARNGEYYLLHAFKESSKNSNKEYNAAIKTASNRIALL